MPKQQTFHATGERLVEELRRLLHEGNVRRVIVKDRAGKTIAEFPLTFGVAGAVIAPLLAGVSAVVALASDCSITVEREG